MRYPLALLLTLLVEIPVYLAALTVPSRHTMLAAAAGMNLLTHPVAWWLISAAPPGGYVAAFLLVEAAVVLTEAELLRRTLRLRPALAYAASLTANAASALAGLLLT